MYTLAHAHFAEYEDIPDPSDLLPSELPGGALILAMQAVSLALHVTSQDFAYFIFFSFQVEHAFKFWKTGEFIEDKTSHFSADNYGDTVKRKAGPDRSYGVSDGEAECISGLTEWEATELGVP
jgi:hypothetical protein